MQSLTNNSCSARMALKWFVLTPLIQFILGCTEVTTVDQEVWVADVDGGGFDDIGQGNRSIYCNAWPDFPWHQEVYSKAGGHATGFGSLRAPINSDTADRAGYRGSGFGFVATQDFVLEHSKGDSCLARDSVVVVKAGIQAVIEALPAAGKLRLRFDYAFMTGEHDTGPTHNDFATVILILHEQDDKALTILSVDRNQLQEGGVGPVSRLAVDPRIGCGIQSFGDTSASYPLCTGWRQAVFDITPYAGQRVTLQFTVQEVGGNSKATALLFDNVRFTRVE